MGWLTVDTQHISIFYHSHATPLFSSSLNFFFSFNFWFCFLSCFGFSAPSLAPLTSIKAFSMNYISNIFIMTWPNTMKYHCLVPTLNSGIIHSRTSLKQSNKSLVRFCDVHSTLSSNKRSNLIRSYKYFHEPQTKMTGKPSDFCTICINSSYHGHFLQCLSAKQLGQAINKPFISSCDIWKE